MSIHHIKNMRGGIFGALFLAAAVFGQAGIGSETGPNASGENVQVKMPLTAFDYSGVRLDDGPAKRQFDEVREFYLRIPNDDLLKGFRQRAGLPAPGADLGGWYSADLGNIFGQILSGLSRMYRASGDLACRAKVDTLIAEWGKCIGPDGYPFFSLHPQGVAYIYDKLVGGLADAILYGGSKEAPLHLARITDWAEKHINRVRDYANADGGGAPRVDWSEWYTMGENLYRAFLATGDERYREFAKVWEYDEYWSIYARRGDIFAPRPNGQTTRAYHAYSHVNTLRSAAAAYQVSGERRYLDTIRNAYDYLQAEQCFATGGFGPDEQLAPPAERLRLLGATHNSVETQCTSWAGFKLGRYLMLFTGSARYGDWIERIFYNNIGASLPNAPDGRVFYYADYNPRGGKKVLYDSGWSCCSGSRPMAVAAFHDIIYFKDDAGLYVNLFVPSTVEWNGATVRQRTRFPETDVTELTVSASQPSAFGLSFRSPAWLIAPMTVAVNGRAVPADADERHWVTVRREWRNGDKVVVRLPMGFRAEALDAKAGPSAICFGPVVMALKSPNGNPAGRIDLRRLDQDWAAVPGEPLTFRLRGDVGLVMQPFYAFKENEPYFLYLDRAVK